MNMDINNTLNETAQHMAWVQAVYSVMDSMALSAAEIDEHMERFVRSFFPEYYEEIFK